MEYQLNEATQRLNKKLKEDVLSAIKNNDLDQLRELKSQIGRNRWLYTWAANGSKMEDWIL